MNVSLYQAAAAMNAHARWQELIAENLAAGFVPGSRKQDVSFSAVEAGLASAGGNGSRCVIPAAHATTNFQPGEIRPGGSQMDFAIEGPGWFAVQLPNGAQAYTRNGEFHLNAQGQLVTKQGDPVLGDGGPVQFDPSQPPDFTVSASGEISQGGQLKGRLRLVEFADPRTLMPTGGGYFQTNLANAKPAAASAVHQGFLEESNMSPMVEMGELITAMRMFEANQKVLQAQDDRMGRAISDLAGAS